MKRSTTVLSLLIASGIIFSGQAASASDLSTDHWAYNDFMYGKEKGFVQGDDKGNFNPDKIVTRAEFAKMLTTAMKLELDGNSSTKISFADVQEGDWYYDFVLTAAQNGLIKGKSETAFEPNADITREEMAVMLYRSVKLLGYDSAVFTLDFKDSHKISSWASLEISYILSNGLLTGLPDGNFAPQQPSLRSAAVTVIKRLLEIDPENPIKGVAKEVKIPYTSTFEYALQKQLAADPKADGGGLFKASKEAVEYFMHPGTIDALDAYYYQFLKLNEVITGLTVAEVNATGLNNVGVLSSTAESFMKAGEQHKVNFIYLIAHAVHETGKGTSQLAKGNRVGLNADGKPELVTDDAHAATLTDVRVVYNMYGIGAKDTAPLKLGAERAYSEGWFTIEDAIIGGAAFVSNNYFERGQDTLYKMKWNPLFPGNLQYATHIVWATIQAERIKAMYETIGADKKTNSVFEIPVYADQTPPPTTKPSMEQWFALDTKNAGLKGKTNTEGLNIRLYPGTGNSLGRLPINTEITVIGENNNWYKVTTSTGATGWVSGEYITWDLIGKTVTIVSDIGLKLRVTPVDGEIIVVIPNNGTAEILEVSDGWYRVKYGEQEGWISAQYTKINP